MTFELFAIGAGLALLLLMVPAIVRIVAGPTALDRIVAVNAIGTKTAMMAIQALSRRNGCSVTSVRLMSWRRSNASCRSASSASSAM